MPMVLTKDADRNPPSDSCRIPWTSPFLRWAGSKRKLLPLLLRAVPQDVNRYIEPFAGSACLFFGLRPSVAILGELNPHLIEVYEQVRAHPRIISRTIRSMPRTEDFYYRARALDPSTLDPISRVCRFVYLNRNCFNGVYRTNRQGQFNVPIGKDTGDLPSELALVRCAIALRKATLKCMDFEHLLREVRKGDFVYLDPPYKLFGRKGFGEYGYGSFATRDVARLIRCLRTIDNIGGVFLLSYCDTDELHALPRHWHSQHLTVRRHIAGFASYRETVGEILLSNRRLFI